MTKDFYKNPFLYYILGPALIVLWPISVALLYLPDAKKNYIKEEKLCAEANDLMLNILKLDEGRLLPKGSANTSTTFDFAAAIGEAARSCRLSSEYNISSDPIRTKDQRKTQDASVILQKISMVDLANFLSTLQRRWAGLECEMVSFTKVKGLPDIWKVTVKFKYYF